MLRLTTLGGVDLRSPRGEAAAVLRQPKRLALLAYLARGVAAGKFVRRDSLLALFWPDLNQDHARAALRRAIYFLRQALGDDVIEGRGDDELRLSPHALTCDATEFEAALAARDEPGARALYSGDFMPGFYVAGAPDAEAWIDEERDRLRLMADRIAPRTAPARAPAAADKVIAIMPFDAAGQSLGYLAEGMVDLLHAAFDGLPGWRVVDPRVLLAKLQQAKGAADVDSAERLAATHVLRGRVEQDNGTVRLAASLEPLGSGAPARAETVGDSEQALFDMVDDVVRRLLASQPAAASQDISRIAARTTTSLSALKAWLAGEHHFRLARHREAAASFEEATRADASFALAWYRLASSRAALADITRARAASESAMRHRDRLAQDAMNLLEAQHAWLAGRPAEAERRYRDAVERHQDDVESWYLLGDVLFHGNPYRGRSIRQARPALERALALDDDHLGALSKLARLDALDGNDEDLARRVDRYLDVSPEADQALAMRALRAWRLGKMAEKVSLMGALRHARPLSVAIAFGDVALYTNGAAELETMGRAMLTAVRSAELRALCRVMLAHVMLSRGHCGAAEDELGRARQDNFDWVIGVQGLLAAVPFFQWSDGFVAATTAQLQEWAAVSAKQHETEPLNQHNNLQHVIRVYALGLLAARRGDHVVVSGFAEELAEISVLEEGDALTERMGRTLSALVRRLRGDPAGALAMLEGSQHDIWYQLAVGSPVFAGTYERYLRAELLAENGRQEEAIGWLAAIGERTPWELPFIGPARALRQRLSGAPA